MHRTHEMEEITSHLFWEERQSERFMSRTVRVIRRWKGAMARKIGGSYFGFCMVVLTRVV
jgi:hypothetical protein